jgi:hypothetical protein
LYYEYLTSKAFDGFGDFRIEELVILIVKYADKKCAAEPD